MERREQLIRIGNQIFDALNPTRQFPIGFMQHSHMPKSLRRPIGATLVGRVGRMGGGRVWRTASMQVGRAGDVAPGGGAVPAGGAAAAGGEAGGEAGGAPAPPRAAFALMGRAGSVEAPF